MNKNDFKDLLEESGLDDQKLQEVLYYFDKIQEDPKLIPKQYQKDYIADILEEDNWRKRAVLAAKNISNNLE